MKNIKLGKFIVGEHKPVVVIAEVASQHGGSMESAKRLIFAAKEAGVDMVKFQLHIADVEVIPNSVKFWGGSMDEVLKKAGFSTYEEHKELKEYCDKVGIQYLCTPFSKEASDILERVGVSAYKTGSGELTNLPMLRHIARKGKPMIVSTGMCTMDEISDAVEVLRQEGCDFILTHCLSEYPPRYEHMNLGLIPLLSKKFGVFVGLSDHSTEIYSAIAAVALGARVIEKHFTLRDLTGPDDIVSLDPGQLKELVIAIRKTEKSLGNKKGISKDEQVVRNWAHHSVVSSRDIKKGEKIALNNVVAKRPGSGISAKYLDPLHSKKLLGKKFKKDIPGNTLVQWKDLT